MSASVPLLRTIEPDDATPPTQLPGQINSSPGNVAKTPIVLTPTNHSSSGMASTPGDAENGELSGNISASTQVNARHIGIAGIFRQVRKRNVSPG